jgi:hypothetical protein
MRRRAHPEGDGWQAISLPWDGVALSTSVRSSHPTSSGVRNGDKCYCVVAAPPTEGTLYDVLATPEVRQALATAQVELVDPSSTYMSMAEFSGDALIDFWDETVRQATIADSYPFVRITGEMPPSLRETPGRAEFFRYEALLNDWITKYPQAVVCLYDLRYWGSGMLVDIVRTHPRVMVGGLVFDNPYYSNPAVATAVS